MSRFIKDSYGVGYIPDGSYFLKRIKGIALLKKMQRPPLYGGVPIFYRGRDWCIENKYYQNSGIDIINNLNPFNDGSLIAKLQLDGSTTELIANQPSTVVGTVYYGDGVFDQKCYSSPSKVVGGNYLYTTRSLPLVTNKQLTVAGFVKMINPEMGESIAWGITPNLANPNPNQSLILSSSGIKLNSLLSNGAVNVLPYIFSKPIMSWMHVILTMSEKEMRMYINGELVNKIIPDNYAFSLANSFVTVGSNKTINNAKVQQLEVYNRMISDDEAVMLYNQELFRPVPCDGFKNDTTDNPLPFAYLEDEATNQLMKYRLDEDGNIIEEIKENKSGVVTGLTNLVTISDNDKICDKYGNSIEGFVQKVKTFVGTTIAISGDTGWTSFNKFKMSIDTNKSDYLIIANFPLTKNASGAGGSISLTINGRVIDTVDIGAGLPASSQYHALQFVCTSGFPAAGECEFSLELAENGDQANNQLSTTNTAGAGTSRPGTQNKSIVTVIEISKREI